MSKKLWILVVLLLAISKAHAGSTVSILDEYSGDEITWDGN